MSSPIEWCTIINYKLTPQLMFKFCTALHFPSQSTASAKFFKFCQCRLPSNIAGTRWMKPTSSLFDNFCLKNDVFCFLCNLVFTFPHLHSTWLIFWWFLMVFFYHNTPGGFESFRDRVTRFSSWGLCHWSFSPWFRISVIFELIFSLENSQRYYIWNSMRPGNFFSLNSCFPMNKQILQLGHTGLNLKHLSVIQRAQLHCPPPHPML